MFEAVDPIGYSFRPTVGGRGIATWALKAILPHARSIGLTGVLLTCDEQNMPSARTIEKNGGALEDIRSTELGVKRRYWIYLSGCPGAQTSEGSSSGQQPSCFLGAYWTPNLRGPAFIRGPRISIGKVLRGFCLCEESIALEDGSSRDADISAQLRQALCARVCL